MHVGYGKGQTDEGPGILIHLSKEEVATAISAYLTSHCIQVHGARTISIEGEQVKPAEIYVDPSGYVVVRGAKMLGSGPTPTE